MKKIMLLGALVVSMMASAQIVEVVSVKQLTTTDNMDTKVAGISPDGKYVLLTSGSNVGLQKLDVATGELSVLTDAAGAGYNAQISDDGAEVVYRKTTIGKDQLRRSSLVRHNLATRQEQTVLKETRNLEGFSLHNNTLTAVDKRKVQRQSLNEQKAADMPVVSISNRQLMLTRNGKTTVLSPNGQDKSYIWPSISPDGKKVCYYVMNEGCYVADIDGSNPQFVAANCRAAKWYNSYVLIAMEDKDNGEYITESAIVAYTISGEKQVLTAGNMIAMYPYISQDGSKIAFSTAKGEAYLMSIKVK